MIKLIKFIPLGSANDNFRSFVYIENLLDFIELCINHPNARNQIYLISDGQDLSTTELIHLIAKSLGKKVYLIPVPFLVISFIFRLIGCKDAPHKLFESLRVNIDKNYNQLSWRPKVRIEDAFMRVFGGRDVL